MCYNSYMIINRSKEGEELYGKDTKKYIKTSSAICQTKWHTGLQYVYNMQKRK